MQYTIFLALVPVAALIMLVVGVLAWLRRDRGSAIALLWLALGTLGWLVFNTLELVSTSAAGTLRWAKVTYVFIAATPLAWLAFALSYIGRTEWLKPSRLALLGLVPSITAVVALTNALHGFLWREYHFVPASSLLHMRPIEYGFWFWINTLFTYAYVMLGAGLILAHYVQSARIYRRQARWVVVGALSPVALNAIYVFRLIPGWTKDYSPLGLALAGFCFAVSIFRHGLLDLRPVGCRQLIERMRDAVVVVDGQRRVVEANPAARPIVGAGEGETVGRSLSEVLPVAASLLPLAPSDQVAREDISIEQGGEVRRYELRLSILEDRRGRLLGHLIMLHDVTERMETIARLRRQERLAAIGQLAGGIAHDFNNLLGSITLHAQLAQRDVTRKPDIVVENLDVIVQESQRAAKLVDQILDFSRTQEMESEPLDLGYFVRDVAEVLRRTIREDVRLVVETPPGPCVIDADPTRIQQVLLNLATNARDAMPDGGDLRISVEPYASPSGRNLAAGDSTPRWARLTVSDTGVGMDDATRQHIFEPFFTTKEPDAGTGLGLAQVYAIVKRHDGRIDVETGVGEGTTFIIDLPLASVQEAESKAEPEQTPARGSGETILVVEDAERFRRGIGQGLEALNYRVVTASNGREALEAASLGAVDLVLTDVVMPEMGGRALLQGLRERALQLPVIAMTGFAKGSDVQDLRNDGFDAAILKPFSIPELGEVVRAALDRRDA